MSLSMITLKKKHFFAFYFKCVQKQIQPEINSFLTQNFHACLLLSVYFYFYICQIKSSTNWAHTWIILVLLAMQTIWDHLNTSPVYIKSHKLATNQTPVSDIQMVNCQVTDAIWILNRSQMGKIGCDVL